MENRKGAVMKLHRIKGMDVFIEKANIQGYKIVTASNGYKCRFMGYTDKQILSKLRKGAV